MGNSISRAEQEFTDGNFDACFELVNSIISKENFNVDALMLRAKLNYNWQKWGDALNDLNRIIDLDSNHQLAVNYKLMIVNILTYWNKDNYNP
ncbi:MAG: hypothetical protein ACERKD_12590 [Prolixibacteraceae bacterium]